ncbi:MAG: hypothetical protein FWD32_03120 [Firmicutes bacterium]|nr:hypothetical protein [Bacillota bacterium]
MNLKGRGGISYVLENSPFAQGGEGMIFNVTGQPGIVAKIYKSHITDLSSRENKINIMVLNPPDEKVLSQITWPLDALYNSSGSFVGFTMPKVKINEDLNVIYEYGSSAKFPHMPWSSKVVVAQNICAVLHAVHTAGHVVGDLNPKNISVSPATGHILMVDTDSYHIKDGQYKCSVALPDYVAPEVQKKAKTHGGASYDSLPLPTFTKETDNFALAIHIFQLLMNGVHPYSCAILPSAKSVAVPDTNNSILNGLCPFLKDIKNITIPKFAPPITILPKEIQNMFYDAFIEGHTNPSKRPTAEQWFYALKKISKDVSKCGKVNYHDYSGTLKFCPWCEADMRFRGAIASSQSAISQSKIATPAVAAPKYTTQSTNTNTQTSNTPVYYDYGFLDWVFLVFFVLFGILAITTIIFYTSIKMEGVDAGELPRWLEVLITGSILFIGNLAGMGFWGDTNSDFNTVFYMCLILATISFLFWRAFREAKRKPQVIVISFIAFIAIIMLITCIVKIFPAISDAINGGIL